MDKEYIRTAELNAHTQNITLPKLHEVFRATKNNYKSPIISRFFLS